MNGSCHCGATRFEVPAAPEWLGECNCSFCTKRGALWAYYPAEQLSLLNPPEGQATYRWNSGLVSHHHCATCGCATFSESPSFGADGPDFSKPRVGLNARLLDGFDTGAAERRPIDGASFPLMRATGG